MKDLDVVKYLLARVENNIGKLDEYKNKNIQVRKQVEDDKKQGLKDTRWKRERELECDDPCCKSEIKDTLRLIRKITLDIERKIEQDSGIY